MRSLSLTSSFSMSSKIAYYLKYYEPIWYPLGIWFLTLLLAIFISHSFHTIDLITKQHLRDIGFSNWDGAYFLSIAKNGGYHSLSDTAFFPLLPLLINLLHRVTHWSFENCGFVITNFSYLIALIMLYQLSLMRSNDDKQLSRNVLWLLTTFPTAMFFHAIYSESITLLTTVLFFYFLETDHWFFAMLSGCCAAAVHTLGILVAPVGLYHLWCIRHRLTTYIFWQRFLSLIIIGAGLLLYMGYLQLHYGNPFSFLLAEKSWHRTAVIPLINIIFQIKRFIIYHPHGFSVWIFTNIVNGIATLWMALLIYLMLWRDRYDTLISNEMKIFFILTLLASISSGAYYGSLMSYGRFMVVLFPGFLLWAKMMMRHTTLFLLIVIMMMTIKVLFQGFFFAGYPVV